MYPKVTLICGTCGAMARRKLMHVPSCRGVHETPSEPALCPLGHGHMVRKDSVNQEGWTKRFVQIWGAT